MTKPAFSKISIPLIKKVYPSLIASNLLNVQPLAASSGLVHYLRHAYSGMKKKFEIVLELNKPIVNNEGLPDILVYQTACFDGPSKNYKGFEQNFNSKILHLLNTDKSIYKKVYQISYSMIYSNLELCIRDLNACMKGESLKELDKGSLDYLFNYLHENDFEINRVRINIDYDKECEKECIYMESNFSLFDSDDEEGLNLYKVIFPDLDKKTKSIKRIFDPYKFTDFAKSWPHNCHMCLYDSNVNLDQDWIENSS